MLYIHPFLLVQSLQSKQTTEFCVKSDRKINLQTHSSFVNPSYLWLWSVGGKAAADEIEEAVWAA